MDKLKKIIAEIKFSDSPAPSEYIDNDIKLGLADVLLALEKSKKEVFISPRIVNSFIIFSSNKINYYYWSLKKDLDWHYKNKPETIKFLKDLLTK